MEGVERGDSVADLVLFHCGVVEFVVDPQIHSKLVIHSSRNTFNRGICVFGRVRLTNRESKGINPCSPTVQI